VVLLLTDLGIGRPLFARESATPAVWRGFLEELRRAGCAPVALVPYAPARWPPALRRALPIILWDRRTSAGHVRHVVGPAHEVDL
jgi:hypothetical protein